MTAAQGQEPAFAPLYVARNAREVGVSPPGFPGSNCGDRGCTLHTSDWRRPKGSPENTHGVLAAYHPTDVAVLRERRYRTEAHFVAYELFDRETGEALGTQPRVRKIALPWLREQGIDVRLGWLLADVDTPGHEPWTSATRAVFDELWQRAPGPLATCGVYLSPKGYRLMQPLSGEYLVEPAERVLHQWLEELCAAGVWESAREARDWTRHMRTPHHLRVGAAVESPWQDWSRCRAISPAVPASVERPPRKRRAGTTQPRPVTHFDETCPPGWDRVAEALGQAIRDTVKADWRRCYLALSGALISRGCPPEAVPAVIAAAHLVDPQWAHLLQDRVQIARDSVTKWGAGVEISGTEQLRKHYATVADVLDRETSAGSEAYVLRQIRSVERKVIDLDDATKTLRAEIRDAFGVTLIAGPPGLGKTEAVVEYSRGLAAIDGRAKAGQRIALSAPTTRLAKEIEERAKARGVKTLRVFGSISHREGEEFVCIHRERALPLVQGGQSLEHLFCQPDGAPPCERAEDCSARPGKIGDEDANLVLGPHELLGRLATAAGKHGAIVIDEPPSLVGSKTFPVEAVERAIERLEDFAADYARDLRAPLKALVRWALGVEPGQAATGSEALAVGLPGVPEEDLAEAVRTLAGDARFDAVLVGAQRAREHARTIAPPISRSALNRARRSSAFAADLGRASEVLLAVYRALQPAAEGLAPTICRVTEREEKRHLSLVGPNDLAIETLRRDAPTILLDAGAQLLAPAVQRIVGFAPRLVELDVADGASVARCVLATRSATRKALHGRGKLDADAAISLLRMALAWAAEGGASDQIVVVSWRDVEALLALVLGLPEAERLLDEAGVSSQCAATVRNKLESASRPFAGRMRTAHYGALRGLDLYRDFDAIATIGDPRPPVNEETDKAAWLNVEADGRLDALAGAELDQAHGRLRLIHRTKPARALHIGSVLPAGWRGRDVEVRRPTGGRPRADTSNTIAPQAMREQRLAKGLSLQELSNRTGISKRTLIRYECSEVPISKESSEKITVALLF